jgi:hypothetical protein
VRPSDPWGPAIYAFDKVVANLGWAHDTDKIVFAHTHHPLDGVTKPGGGIRYGDSVAGSPVPERPRRAMRSSTWPSHSSSAPSAGSSH